MSGRASCSQKGFTVFDYRSKKVAESGREHKSSECVPGDFQRDGRASFLPWPGGFFVVRHQSKCDCALQLRVHFAAACNAALDLIRPKPTSSYIFRSHGDICAILCPCGPRFHCILSSQQDGADQIYSYHGRVLMALLLFDSSKDTRP